MINYTASEDEKKSKMNRRRKILTEKAIEKMFLS
jgi:hypothetical protein